MKNQYDTIIVGSGPSGSAAAKMLANKGLSVLIVEKKKLPRYKICSGIIFKKSLQIVEKNFGKLPDHVFVTPNFYKGVRMWDIDGSHTDYPFRMMDQGAPNVWRSEFDHWLAENSGAEIADETRVVDFNQSGNQIEINCVKSGEQLNFTSKFLISAEGSYSTIRTKLDPEFEKGLEWSIAYQNYYEGSSDLDPQFYHGFLDKKFGDVYAWFNVKEGLMVFGTALDRGHMLAPYLSEYTKFLEEKHNLKLGPLVRKASCVGSNMCSTGRFYLGRNNILFVGESAGFLNMFGEGISSALATGVLAGNAICEAIDSNKDAAQIYEDTAKKEKKSTTISWKMAERMANRKVM